MNQKKGGFEISLAPSPLSNFSLEIALNAWLSPIMPFSQSSQNSPANQYVQPTGNSTPSWTIQQSNQQVRSIERNICKEDNKFITLLQKAYRPMQSVAWHICFQSKQDMAWNKSCNVLRKCLFSTTGCEMDGFKHGLIEFNLKALAVPATVLSSLEYIHSIKGM